MRFQIDWASLIVGSKFTVFALFYFVFEGNFSSTSSRGAYIWRGDLTEGFLRCRFGGRIFGGAFTWRAYFRNFTVIVQAVANAHNCVIHITQSDRVDKPDGTIITPVNSFIRSCTQFPRTLMNAT